MSKNYQAFLKLNEAPYRGKYIIIVDGRVVKSGKNVETIFKQVQKKYPRETPFIAKIPQAGVMIL